MTEVRSCVKRILQTRKMNLVQLTAALEYKSKTSIIRILDEDVRIKSALDFEKKINTKLGLTPDESQALHDALQIKIRGREACQMEKEIESLIRFSETAPLSDGMRLATVQELEREHDWSDPASLTGRGLAEHYANVHDIHIYIANEGLLAGIRQLFEILKRPDVQVTHFLYTRPRLSDTLHNLTSYLPVFYCTRYQMYFQEEEPVEDTPVPMRSSAHMMVQYTTEDGKRMEDLVGFASRRQGVILASYPSEGLFDHVISRVRGSARVIKRDFQEDLSVKGVLDFLQYCAGLEKNVSFWRIKKDFCLDCVPREILKAAVTNLPMDDEIQEEVLTCMENRHRENLRTKHMVYQVFKKSAFESFARSGVISDHPIFLRPFTRHERSEILKSLLETASTNLHHRILFLKDESEVGDLEIDCYHKKGLLLLPSHVDYNFQNNYSEALIPYEPLTEAFGMYFVQTFMKKACLSDNESVAYLRSLLERISV